MYIAMNIAICITWCAQLGARLRFPTVPRGNRMERFTPVAVRAPDSMASRLIDATWLCHQ